MTTEKLSKAQSLQCKINSNKEILAGLKRGDVTGVLRSIDRHNGCIPYDESKDVETEDIIAALQSVFTARLQKAEREFTEL